MSYWCSECLIAWYPYQATQGLCPICSSGTARRPDPPSSDNYVHFELVKIERARRDRLESFKRYCAERESQAA